MQRTKFVESQALRPLDAKLLRYKEACVVFEEFEKLKKQLAHMGAIFADVEDAINNALTKIPNVTLVYGFKDENASLRDANGNLLRDSHRDYTEAFTHNGSKFEVSFQLRNTNPTLVYPIALKIIDVLGLTEEALVVRIRRQLHYR